MLHYARRAAPELHLILLAQDMENHITNWRFQHVEATHPLFWTSLIPFCMGNLQKRIWMLLSRSCTQNEFLRRMVWSTAAWHSKGVHSKFVDLKRTWIVMPKLGQNDAIYRTHWNEQGFWDRNFQKFRSGSRLGLQHLRLYGMFGWSEVLLGKIVTKTLTMLFAMGSHSSTESIPSSSKAFWQLKLCTDDPVVHSTKLFLT